jgi:hypothetical protein
MLRKLTFAVAAALLASGVAAAQSQSPFPMSVNEAGPYEPETYYAPSGSPAAAPAIGESSTFPMSVSESGLNYPDVYATTAPAAVQPSHASLLAASKFGSRAETSAAMKTVRVEPSTRYINVSHFDQVRLVDQKGQSFTWKFDTLDEMKFPLTAIAPSGFDAARAVVYVRHPQSHVATD